MKFFGLITNNGKIIRKYAYGALSDNSRFEKIRKILEKKDKMRKGK